jgi:MinD superfamily P-loop ATPase
MDQITTKALKLLYRITARCTARGLCLDACQVEVISEREAYLIDGYHCLECGRCAEVCLEDAIEAAAEM